MTINFIPETMPYEKTIRRYNAGNRIRMTYPMSTRHEVEINGKLVRLRPQVHRFCEILLMRGPRGWLWRDELVELLWPDPDSQALTAFRVLQANQEILKEVGVPLETYFGWGCRIASEANE